MAADGDELERFRKQWREEVTRRERRELEAARTAASASRAAPSAHADSSQRGLELPLSTRVLPSAQDDARVEPRTFHDLPDREDRLRLGSSRDVDPAEELLDPVSALDHYERAVEEEVAGKLGRSVASYRKAFRLDPRVHHVYKEKHFPQPLQAAKASGQKAETAGRAAGDADPSATSAETAVAAPASVAELVDQFSNLAIVPAPPETDLSDPPPCPVAHLPEEVLVTILQVLVRLDVALAARLPLVCRRFAYILMTENSIWRPVVLGERFGLKAMHYRYFCDLRGFPLAAGDSSKTLISYLLKQRPDVIDLTPSKYPSYRAQFRHRPRIRFNGCYISTINYQRQGASAQSHFTWTNPVHIVTYYRYIRFFRDGTVISLLTTSEPADVVHYLSKENMHDHHAGGLPTYVMKDALSGRWRLTGPGSSLVSEETVESSLTASTNRPGQYAKEPLSELPATEDVIESEGDVHIETDGVIPKYMWKMQFALASAGRKDGPRNNKLNWKGFWYYNRLTNDWGEFSRKNDRPYYFSRVKSYGMGFDN